MTTDLITFITARLDEDHDAASKAASLCGCHPPATVWQFDDEATDGRILIEDDPHPATDASPSRLRKRWNGSYANLFAARHIARHDPARVLREVEAKREILAEHHPVDPCDAHDAELRTVMCATLVLLAAPYSDHPDFRSEWAP